MPMYVYEAKEGAKGCAKCRAGFEIAQSINDPKLTACPDCGGPIFRVIQAPGLGHSQTDLHYRAKRAGFSCLKKVQKSKALERSLETAIPDAVYDRLCKELEVGANG